MSDDTLRQISPSDLVLGARSPRHSALAVREQAQRSAPQTITHDAAANECSACDGVGWYVLRVATSDPRWGKTQPCECTLRQREQMQRLKYRALFEQLHSEMGGELSRCNLDNYSLSRASAISGSSAEQCLATMQHALDTCRAYADQPVGWLYLYGPTGVGKSHLAAAVAQHVATTRLAHVCYASEPALMSFLRGGKLGRCESVGNTTAAVSA
jgi:DNA replication protein DnaC